jgi:hypothetical protein
MALLGLAALLSIAVACPSASSGGSGTADEPASQPTSAPVADEAPAASDAQPTSTGESASGLDLECVNSVLGREVSGFGDVSTAERDRIFSQCSGDDPAPQRGNRALGSERFAGLLECAAEALGREISSIQDLTAEDRAAISEPCGDQPGGGPGGRGIIGAPDGRAFGGFGGFDFDSPCISEALGRIPTGFGDLTPEDFEKLAEACPDEVGGVQRFGGGPGGGLFGGDGLAGQFGGGFDLTCLSEALGRDITDPAELRTLTPEDFTKIAEACGGQFGGQRLGPGGEDGAGGQGGLFRGNRGDGGGSAGGGINGFGGGPQAIDQECVAGIIGGSSGGFAQITAEQRARIFEECATQSE